MRLWLLVGVVLACAACSYVSSVVYVNDQPAAVVVTWTSNPASPGCGGVGLGKPMRSWWGYRSVFGATMETKLDPTVRQVEVPPGSALTLCWWTNRNASTHLPVLGAEVAFVGERGSTPVVFEVRGGNLLSHTMPR